MSTGYLDRKSSRPGSLTLALAIHGGVLAAILLAKPTLFIPQPDDPTVFRPIYVPVPPPPRPETPKQERRPAQPNPDPQPVPQDPPIDSSQSLNGGVTDYPPAPPLPPAPPTTPTFDPPSPVLTTASFDRRYLGDLQPAYPPYLERLEKEGTVTVRVQIGTDGRVLAVELVRADDPGFFAATRDWAMRKWRFKPATRDGAPVTGWLTETVRFQIQRT